MDRHVLITVTLANLNALLLILGDKEGMEKDNVKCAIEQIKEIYDAEKWGLKNK